MPKDFVPDRFLTPGYIQCAACDQEFEAIGIYSRPYDSILLACVHCSFENLVESWFEYDDDSELR